MAVDSNRTSKQRAADIPRDTLLGKTLRQRTHQLRIEACSAWSDVVQKPISGLDAAKCDYAKAIEDRLRAIIDELADLSSLSETTADCSTGTGGVTLAQMAENIKRGVDPYAVSEMTACPFVVYRSCAKHVGIPWTLSATYTTPPKEVCPICEPPEKASDSSL